ncbi:hypothetical protein QTP88_021967 [Uroleucon formosanum]
MSRTLRIITWNTNGLVQRKQELEHLMNKEKIDIVLIPETHFTTWATLKLRGYRIYTTEHPSNRAHGGTEVIIKETIKHYELDKHPQEHLQASSVHIKDGNIDLTISAIYCPPRHKVDDKKFIEFFQTLGSRFIAGRDYNAKHTFWGSRLITTKGRELFKSANIIKAQFISPRKPTYWPTDPNKLPEVIDFYVMNGISSNYTKVEGLLELTSDHISVLLSLSSDVIMKQKRMPITNKKTNWDLFRNTLEENIFSTRLKTIADIKIAVKKNNQRHCQCGRNSNSGSYQCKILYAKIKEIKNETFKSYLSGLTVTDNTDYSLWKATRLMKRPRVQIPPFSKKDSTWARSEQEKAEMYARYLEHVSREKIKHFSLLEIAKEIDNNLNPKKSPGYDEISPKILKELPKKAIIHLTHIYNAILSTEYIPEQWKRAQVIMLLKPGKPHENATSY